MQDIAPSLATAGRPLSPAAVTTNVQSMFTHDSQEMDIDSNPSTSQQPGRPPLSETRIRTPLPSGPRLEKSLSLPGIESFKNDLQTSVGRMLSTPSRDRYSSVQALLLFWQDDEDMSAVQSAVGELAEVFDKYYHFAFQIQTIPTSSEGCKSSWRWLSRVLNDFSEDNDEREVLKIVYYAGHTYLDSNREMVLTRFEYLHRYCSIPRNADLRKVRGTPNAPQRSDGVVFNKLWKRPRRTRSSSWMPHTILRRAWFVNRVSWN